MTWLSEWTAGGAANVMQRVIPYLADFDENVRFAAIEAVAHQPDDSARLPLLDALTRPEEESRRLRTRIAEVLAQTGWTVTEKKEPVQKLLASELSDYGMHHDKLVKKGK
jgi:HEAT repeat protein